jgi:hypothetical protein
MQDTAEAQARQEEIGELLAGGGLTAEDDADVLAELDALEALEVYRRFVFSHIQLLCWVRLMS